MRDDDVGAVRCEVRREASPRPPRRAPACRRAPWRSPRAPRPSSGSGRLPADRGRRCSPAPPCRSGRRSNRAGSGSRAGPSSGPRLASRSQSRSTICQNASRLTRASEATTKTTRRSEEADAQIRRPSIGRSTPQRPGRTAVRRAVSSPASIDSLRIAGSWPRRSRSERISCSGRAAGHARPAAGRFVGRGRHPDVLREREEHQQERDDDPAEDHARAARPAVARTAPRSRRRGRAGASRRGCRRGRRIERGRAPS